MLNAPTHTTGRPRQAAMFVDYDNLHAVLTSQGSADVRTSDYVLEILDEVRRYLDEGDDTPTIFGRAYGAFGTYSKGEDREIPSLLFQSGLEPRYVSVDWQRNASELQLSIDATQLLEHRDDIETFVLVTGNRPYHPLARRLREQGRRVLVAAVNPPQTEDVPDVAEDDLYLDARNLLSRDSREDLLVNAPEEGREGAHRSSGDGVPPQRYQRVTNPTARRTIDITDEYFGQYDEVYLTPLLRKLSEVLGPNHDPKALVGELEAAGAVRLEKREGHPHDYTVLIFNDDHPDVRSIRFGEELAADDSAVQHNSSEVDEDSAEADNSPSPSVPDPTAPADPLSSTEASSNDDPGDAESGEPDEYAMDRAVASNASSSDPEEDTDDISSPPDAAPGSSESR